MSILDGTIGSKVTLRIFKYLGTNPSIKWVNNYEFIADAAFDNEVLDTAANDFGAFEAQFHTNAVVFDRYTWSTWEPDSKPYDPFAFITGSFTGGLGGAVPASSYADLSPLDVVFWVTRAVPSGRQGKLFYRGVVGEPWVTAPAGVATIQGNVLQTAFNTAKAAIDGYTFDNLGNDPEAPLKLALLGASGSQRRVRRLEPRGVAINKRDRGYFDRI